MQFKLKAQAQFYSLAFSVALFKTFLFLALVEIVSLVAAFSDTLHMIIAVLLYQRIVFMLEVRILFKGRNYLKPFYFICNSRYKGTPIAVL